MKSHGRRALHFRLINSFLLHSSLSWKPITELPGGLRMQQMKYLGAATGPCLSTAATSLEEMTLVYLIIFQQQRNKHHHVNAVATTVWLSVWDKKLFLKKKKAKKVNYSKTSF